MQERRVGINTRVTDLFRGSLTKSEWGERPYSVIGLEIIHRLTTV